MRLVESLYRGMEHNLSGDFREASGEKFLKEDRSEILDEDKGVNIWLFHPPFRSVSSSEAGWPRSWTSARGGADKTEDPRSKGDRKVIGELEGKDSRERPR